jgi:hypothetical protein
MKKNLLLALWAYLPLLLSAQLITDLGTGRIVELESVASSVSQTMVVASMERLGAHSRVLIHRSTDFGQNWLLVDSILPYPGDTEIPDPVLATDSIGNFYLVVMRVHNASPPTLTTADLNLYKSEDDGLSWNYLSSPHENNAIADYPQLLAGGDGELHLTYALMYEIPLLSNASLIYRKSTDGGLHWGPEIVLSGDHISSIGADLSWGPEGKLFISSGDRNSDSIYVYHSHDRGESWLGPITSVLPPANPPHITKPVYHKDFHYYGLISHQAHNDQAAIYYHAFDGLEWHVQLIAEGAYAQGYLDDDGKIHLIYNQKEANVFKLKYITSEDGGLHFSEPLVLFSGPYDKSEAGEYQSLIHGSDGLFYLTFCDWTDQSSAKTLIFSPNLSTNRFVLPEEFKLYPNPAHSNFTLELPSHYAPHTVILLNLNGEVVRKSVHSSPGNKFEFNIENEPNGLYLILVQEKHRYLLIGKLIKI